MSAPWKSLPISSHKSEQPPLFISATFTSNSYTVQITDLTRLWIESLDRKSILKRSFNEDTAIDPSEDAEQMRLFLQKIEAGIRGDDGTEITLDYDSKNSTPDAPCLKLLVTANLPKPLPPLKWPISLCQSSPSSFTEKITVPLLAAQNARIQEMESLIEVLKNKDHVIQKLVDKLEASGTDLGHIFPTVATKGGKKTTMAYAEEKVKGLGIFDKLRWKKGMAKDQSDGDLQQLARRAFSTVEISHSEAYSIPGPWNAWWEGFEGSTRKLATTSKEVLSAAKLSSAETHESQAQENEEGINHFQVQSTPPPQLQILNKKRSSATLDDSTEDDDDGLDAPSQKSVVPDSFPIHAPPKPATKTSKLGVIGRPKSTVGRSPTLPGDNDEKTTEYEIMNSPPLPIPSLPAPKATASVKPKKGGLGVIGGRRKAVTPPPLSPLFKDESDGQKDDDGIQNVQPKRTPHKLGVIGHRTQRTLSPVEQEMGGRSLVINKKDGSPPRETSEERILRKREEIQKELTEKAKKPVKKKRKF